MRYLRWLQEQTFDYPAHQIVLQEMVDAVRLAKERVERLEQTIAWNRLCDRFGSIAYAPGNTFLHQPGIMLGTLELKLALEPRR